MFKQMNSIRVCFSGVLILFMAGSVHSAGDNKVYESTIDSDSPQEFMKKYAKARTDMQSFESMRENWVRKSSDEKLCHTEYQLDVLKTFPKGKTAYVKPAKDQLIGFQATGLRTHRAAPGRWKVTSQSSRIIAVDIKTKEVLAWREMPENFAGAIHTTAVSPDGKYTYISGPNVDLVMGEDNVQELGGKRTSGFSVKNKKVMASLVGLSNASATMIKIDNETLRPVKVFDLHGRLHHGHVLRNSELMLFDTFNTTGHGNSVFILDPKTDKVVCAINEKALGGHSYTAYSGPKGRYIYIQMEPLFDEYVENPEDAWKVSAYVGSSWYRTGDLQTLPAFWVARLDLESGKVDREYPYPGYRSDYVRADNANEYIYLSAGASDHAIKLSVDTGKVQWRQSTDVGPYGIVLNTDESELWVLNKGETANMWGRTITVVNTATGQIVDSLPSSLQNDHILLAPNGKEMWVTSNGEGAHLVYDAKTRKQTGRINLPGRGDAHGLGMVHFPTGTFREAKLVLDQDGFHGGVDPRIGKTIDY